MPSALTIAPPARLLSRRLVLIGLAVAPLVAACSQDTDLISSASRDDHRADFADQAAWIESDTIAGVAFTPMRLSDTQRAGIVAGHGVYPALGEGGDPMVEVRFEVPRPSDGSVSRITLDELNAIEITFWNFDSQAEVARFEAPLASRKDISTVGLDGELRHDGWVVGALRGQQVLASALTGRKSAYTWNLSMQVSFV